jgi:hypothetical protein
MAWSKPCWRDVPNPAKKRSRPKRRQDHQAAAVQGVVEFQVGHRHIRPAAQAGGNEFAQRFGQMGDVAEGAGARPLGGAEGRAHQIGDIRLAGARGFGGLHEHGLQHIPVNWQLQDLFYYK